MVQEATGMTSEATGITSEAWLKSTKNLDMLKSSQYHHSLLIEINWKRVDLKPEFHTRNHFFQKASESEDLFAKKYVNMLLSVWKKVL